VAGLVFNFNISCNILAEAVGRRAVERFKDAVDLPDDPVQNDLAPGQ
jgi:hypothetical protein